MGVFVPGCPRTFSERRNQLDGVHSLGMEIQLYPSSGDISSVRNTPSVFLARRLLPTIGTASWAFVAIFYDIIARISLKSEQTRNCEWR